MAELERREADGELAVREFGAPEVQELLQLAARLRESAGGDLDDSAILAVAEASGTSPEYVRLALQHAPAAETRKEPIAGRVRKAFLSLDPSVRRLVASGYLACGTGLLSALVGIFGDRSSLGGTLLLLLGIAAVVNAAVARDHRTAVLAGATFGAVAFIARSVFLLLGSALWPIPPGFPAPVILAFAAAGGAAGALGHQWLSKNRARFGLKDPAEERQELLRQMVEIQERLRGTEQALSILSVDMVGSTRLKNGRDHLDVEYTFGEYHRYIEQVSRRHRGRLHSTAGDGVTVAFDHPGDAFAAARAIQAGLFEFNAHRNRLGEPVALRAGIHHGAVMTAGHDLATLNFATVIDVAAHLQKDCPAGGVAISEAAVRMVPNGPQLAGDEVLQVGDVRARVWRPRHSLQTAAPGAALPPPFRA